MKGLPARKPQSVRFTVVARTLTRTSLSFGVGFSTSEIRTTSGGPYLVRTAAFIYSSVYESRIFIRRPQVIGAVNHPISEFGQ